MDLPLSSFRHEAPSIAYFPGGREWFSPVPNDSTCHKSATEAQKGGREVYERHGAGQVPRYPDSGFRDRMQGALAWAKQQELDTDTDVLSDGFSMTDISNSSTVTILISQRPKSLR